MGLSILTIERFTVVCMAQAPGGGAGDLSKWPIKAILFLPYWV